MSDNGTGTLITPVILAGGSGSRLWPLSSEDRPKQFQAIAGRRSMFQQTLLRVADPGRFTAPVIIGNHAHHDQIAGELEATGIEPAAIILEPTGRNTAPAITLAAMMTMACKLGTQILIMPSDHYIRDPGKLIAAIDKARSAARMGAFVTFGIRPDGPETCYGYIKQGEPLGKSLDGLDDDNAADVEGISSVSRFVEKPPTHKAEAMLAEGGYYWNSGMFLFPVAPLLQELNRLKPSIVKTCQAALCAGSVEGNIVQPDLETFAAVENISIDYALMEKTKRAAVVPTDPLWSDVGSWTAVWQISEQDQSQNVTAGDVVLHNVSGAYVRSEGPVTAVVGLRDVIVVNTGDAVIVAAKSHAQDIRRIADIVRQRRPQNEQAANAAVEITEAVAQSMDQDLSGIETALQKEAS